MNKLLIVLLAVCLFSVVSAHAFVKRDAPTATDSVASHYNTIKDKVTELGNDLGKTINDVMNPEVIKKNLNDLIDAANKALSSLKPAAAAGEAKPAA